MAIANTDLKIQRGDSKSYTLFFVDANGTPVDITGWTVYFTVKENVNKTDEEAIITKDVTSHTDPINGETQIPLSSDDTNHVGNYIYDIQYKTDEDIIKTVVEGIIAFAKDITRRTT